MQDKNTKFPHLSPIRARRVIDHARKERLSVFPTIANRNGRYVSRQKKDPFRSFVCKALAGVVVMTLRLF